MAGMMFDRKEQVEFLDIIWEIEGLLPPSLYALRDVKTDNRRHVSSDILEHYAVPQLQKMSKFEEGDFIIHTTSKHVLKIKEVNEQAYIAWECREVDGIMIPFYHSSPIYLSRYRECFFEHYTP